MSSGKMACLDTIAETIDPKMRESTTQANCTLVIGKKAL